MKILQKNQSFLEPLHYKTGSEASIAKHTFYTDSPGKCALTREFHQGKIRLVGGPLMLDVFSLKKTHSGLRQYVSGPINL